MRLSILDQAPISEGQTAQEALAESLSLAQTGEEVGYTRYWIAEHHDLSGLACSAPEVMLSYIGANTKKIRIGAGAVLLPHYKPYKVAEVYNMLATLFLDRIDIGIGRAPGGSAEATNALSDNFLKQVWNMPNLVTDLLDFIDDNFVPENKHVSLSAAPVPTIPPQPWLLGTSKKSAELAAEKGLPYAFGQFMSQNQDSTVIQQYLDNFKPRKDGEKPEVILTVSVICGETMEQAEEIALSSIVWALQKETGQGNNGVPSIGNAKEYLRNDGAKEAIVKQKENLIIGDPKTVKAKIEELQYQYHADEIMMVTITHDPKDRINSYRLIAREFEITQKSS